MELKDRLNTAVAFLSGDLLATIVISNDMIGSVVHGVSILVLGAIGGFGGLLGKSIFMWIEKKFKRK